MRKPDLESKSLGQEKVYPSWGEFKRSYEVYETAVKNKVLTNLDLMSMVTVYLSFEDILNLSEIGFGCLEDVLKTKRMREVLTKQLFNVLVNEGWGNSKPDCGSESFGRSQQKIVNYAKVFCLTGFDVGFTSLFEALLDKLFKKETPNSDIYIF